MLRKIKFIESGFDGARTYQPGEIAEVTTAYACRTILFGHADYVDENGEVVPLTKSYKHLKINMDDLIRRAVPSVLNKLRIFEHVMHARRMYEIGKMEEYEAACADIEQALEDL